MADLNSVGFSTNDENEVDLEGLRTRFRKMSDDKLQRDIKAGEYLRFPARKFREASASGIRGCVARSAGRTGTAETRAVGLMDSSLGEKMPSLPAFSVRIWQTAFLVVFFIVCYLVGLRGWRFGVVFASAVSRASVVCFNL
jgi:hypothetical protein